MSDLVGGISKEDALKIARAQYALSAEQLFDAAARDGEVKVVDFKDCRVIFYNLAAGEPLWVIYVPWGDGPGRWGVGASRVIMVSKIDGRVVYDGSAHDE